MNPLVKIRVTLATCVLRRNREVREAAESLSIEFMHVTVSEREFQKGWPDLLTRQVPEWFVIGESPLGVGVVVNAEQERMYVKALSIITDGRKIDWNMLTSKDRRDVRDTMIFCGHMAYGGQIFVTENKKDFIGHQGSNQKRLELEDLSGTQIMTVAEFCQFCSSRHAR